MKWDDVLARHERLLRRGAPRGGLAGRAVTPSTVRRSTEQLSQQRRTAGGGLRPATRVVGTSTAGHTAAEVDYLCTGTDDDITIQQAIDDVCDAGGGEVLILDGVYGDGSSASVEVDSFEGVTIRGMSWGTVFDTIFVIFDDIASYCRLDSVRMHDAVVNVTGDSDFCIVSNVLCTGTTTYGIFVDAASHVLVTGCVAHDKTAAGISLQSGDFGRVVDCAATTCDQGIEIDAVSVTVADCVTNVCGSSGIAVVNSDWISITGCVVNESDDLGFDIAGGYETTMTGCIANSCIGNGFDLVFGQYTLLTGCVSIFNGGLGVRFYGQTDSLVVGSVVSVNDGGILFTSNANSNKVVGSTIVSNDNTPAITVEDTCILNTITACDLGPGAASVITGQYTTVSNCNLDGGAHSLILDDANDCIITDNLFEGQTSPNLSNDHLFVTGDSNRNLIAHNLFRTEATFTFRYGINIENSTCDNNIVVGNDLQGWLGTAPINDAGTGTLLAYPNDATYGDNFT